MFHTSKYAELLYNNPSSYSSVLFCVLFRLFCLTQKKTFLVWIKIILAYACLLFMRTVVERIASVSKCLNLVISQNRRSNNIFVSLLSVFSSLPRTFRFSSICQNAVIYPHLSCQFKWIQYNTLLLWWQSSSVAIAEIRFGALNKFLFLRFASNQYGNFQH